MDVRDCRGSAAGDLFPYVGILSQTPKGRVKRAPLSPLTREYPSAFEEKNENFFTVTIPSADDKVITAFAHCAENGSLNLSGQGLDGELPACVIESVEEPNWHKNWWEQHKIRKIDVSHNSLTGITPAIAKLFDLETFIAHCNKLETLPRELFTHLPDLREVNLRHNSLHSLRGAAVAKAASLVSIILSDNKLTRLPEELLQLCSLEVLEVAENELASLPEAPWHCSRLVRLDISKNYIGPALPWALRDCTVLRELNASNNQLKDLEGMFDVDPEHGWASSLAYLNLNYNAIGPDMVFSNLLVLDALLASYNRATRMALVNITNLSVLVATNNKLTELPEVSPKLCTVDLTNNYISHLPSALGFVKSLRRAVFTGNPLVSIRPELHQGHAEALKALLRKRTEAPQEEQDAAAQKERCRSELAMVLRLGENSGNLDLQRWGFNSLPPLPPSLRMLDLSKNNLTAGALLTGLFTSSGSATAATQTLVALNLWENKLCDGPRSEGVLCALLVGLPSLEELDVQHNHLGDSSVGFESSVTPLPSKVTRLDVSYNQLTEFPTCFLTGLPALKGLRLSTNQVRTLRTTYLAAGTGLRYLDMSQNLLTELPAWLPRAFTCLETLDVSNNLIPNISFELGFWRSMQEMSLGGNPTKTVRQEIIAKGWPAISAWLQDRIRPGACKVVAMPNEELNLHESDDELWVPMPSRKPAKIQPTPPKQMEPPPAPPRGLTYTPGSSGGVHWVWPKESGKDAAVSKMLDCNSPAGENETTVPEETDRSTSPKQDTCTASAPSVVETDPAIHALREQVAALAEEAKAGGMNRMQRAALCHRLRMKRAELQKAETAATMWQLQPKEEVCSEPSPEADHPGELTWSSFFKSSA
mmetsp:Transcript_1822/g.4570  ORF Transcript_1822/g.4570 Transcript_1822/m.4570 type:complete len:874 (-) Transcript_1822:52-2673(-)